MNAEEASSAKNAESSSRDNKVKAKTKELYEGVNNCEPLCNSSSNNSNNTNEEDAEREDDDSSRDDSSIYQTHGTWGDNNNRNNSDDVPWRGCVCGIIHQRPVPVFWVQCDGPCAAWYNVQAACVQGRSEAEMSVLSEWYCPTCTRRLFRGQQQQQQDNGTQHFNLFQALPPEVGWRIIEFCAAPTYRAAVLLHQLAPTCRAAQYFMSTKSTQLWDLLLQNDYCPSISNNKDNSRAALQPSNAQAPLRSGSSDYSLRSSCRRTEHPMEMVKKAHVSLLHRTEDAFHAIEALANPWNAATTQEQQPEQRRHHHDTAVLTLGKLRTILQQYAPLDVNRPSTRTGRTLLQVVCAADVSERVAVSGVQRLIAAGANPNHYCRAEAPLANRPTLYFAISRAMPQLVATLLDAGAHRVLNVHVTGHFRLTFDTRKVISGTFTPLAFAQALYDQEVVHAKVVPPYWVHKLQAVIGLLRAAQLAARPPGPQLQSFTKRLTAPIITTTTTTITTKHANKARNKRKKDEP